MCEARAARRYKMARRCNRKFALLVEMAVLTLLLAFSSTILIADALIDFEYLPYTRDGPSTRGANFKIGFLPNLQVEVGLADPSRRLLISTDEPDPVNFTVSLDENLPAAMRQGFPLTDHVCYGEVKVIDLPDDIAPISIAAGTNGIERSKGISIVTEGGKKISVQGFNDDFRTSDGFTAYSCDGMYTTQFNRFEYVILSADQLRESSSQDRFSAFLIIPCEEARIQIQPTQILTLTGFLDLQIPPSPLSVRPGSVSMFTAAAGQTLLVTHNDDLTGTIIRSSKPLAVFSGHQCANIPVDATACDHIVEQLPPGLTFGRTYFIVPYADRVSGDVIRVATLTDGTRVTVTCVNSPTSTPQTLQPVAGTNPINRGQYLEYRTPANTQNRLDYKPSYCCIDANEPITVAQYATGYTTDSSLVGKGAPQFGDPFMSIVPSVTQYMNNYTVSSVVGSAGPFPGRFINLAIAAQFFDNTDRARDNIKINGSTVVPVDGYIPFYCSNLEICGYGAQVEVDAGAINVYHETPETGLYVAYYAYQQQNSYGFPAGFELTPISATRAIFEDIVVPENIGTITISVLRVGDLNQRSKGILNYRVTNPEEASVGADFADFGPVELDYRGGNRQVSNLTFQVTILDDDVAEPIERFEIHGTNTQNLLFPDPFMTVTIIDDDGGDVMPEVFFDPTSYSVNENAGIATLTVRTSVPGGPPDGSVVFYTEDGSATTTEDYTGITSAAAIPVNFLPGQATTIVTVPIVNDGTVEPNENFFGRLRSTGVGGVSITQDRADVTILNDDVESAVISLSPLTYDVVESDGVVNVVVTKTGNFQTPIAGTLSTTTGSAGALDYVDGVYQFMILGNETRVSVPISIIDDSIVEQLREQFSVSLSITPQPGLSLGSSQGAVTIVDDDVEIGFNPTQYQVNEQDGQVIFQVENRNPERSGTYTVQFTTVQGSAVEFGGAGGDYVSTTQEVTFANGVRTQNIAVPIIDDSIFESLEEFSGRLTTSDSRVNIGNSEATVEISDNDSAVEVFISPLGYEVDESLGSVQITVQTSRSFSSPITGTITTSDGTAGSTDFTSGTYDFTIPANQRQATVNIPITNDQIVEQLREQFSVNLTIQPQTGIALGNSQSSVTIIDDDGVVISLEPSTQSVTEGSVAVFRVVATGESVLPYSVVFQTVDGTAVAPGDYSTATLTLTTEQLRSGSFQVRIPIRNDSVVEARERFLGRLQLTQQSVDLGVVTLGQSTGEVTIIDDDVASIGFNPSSYLIQEDSGSVIFFIENRNPDIQREVVVEFITRDDTAIDGSDFVGKTESVTFQPGQSLAIVQVDLIDDNVQERVEQFFAELTTTDSGVSIYEPDATATILDEDAVVIQFNPTSYTVTEGGSVELVIQKIGTSEQPVTVTLSTLTGTADSSDFIQVTNQSVTFGASEFEKRVLIQTNPDSLVEGNEQFISRLVPVTDRVVVTQDTADITIQETSNVVVEFQPNSYTVNEDDGVVTFVLVKRTPTTQNVSVLITTVDDSATSGSDYSGGQEVVTFGPSETVKFIMVGITSDNIFEGEEVFTATLTTVQGSSGVEIGSQGTASTTILDDVLISFSSPRYTIPENGGTVEVCLTTSDVVSRPVSVVILAQESEPRDAIDSSDFSGGEYRVTIPAGSSEGCTEIGVTDDSLAFEGDELFTIRFDVTQLPEGVHLGPTNITTVRILDNDNVRVFFDQESYVVAENNGSVEVCVRREGDAVESFTINVATANSNPVQAQAGNDYDSVTTTLTFSPSDIKKCFQVSIILDNINEGKEEFTAVITSVPPGVLISQPETTTISIVDANVVMVEFGSPDYSVPENGGPVTVCLTTNIGSDRPLNVIVATAPKTATAGDDYESRTRIVEIPASPVPGETCFQIDITNDSIVEANEEFLVNFQIAQGSDAEIGGVASTCVQIIDDDEESSVSFERETYTVDEDSGSVSVCIRRDGGDLSTSLPVQIETNNLIPVDATAGRDYISQNLSVIIQPNQNRQCFEVEIINDQLDEDTESFTVDIVSVPIGSGAVIGTPGQTTVSIIDDDVLRVDFTSSTYTVPEDGGTVEICLQTNLGNDEQVSLTISTAPKSATPGLDYSSSTQVVSISPSVGPSETCFNININDDLEVESNEEFLVTFQVPAGSNVLPGSISSTCVTITDNDEIAVVEFVEPSYTVNEDAGEVEVCLMLDGSISQPAIVQLLALPLTAEPGEDYVPGLLNFVNFQPPGNAEACTKFEIIDDQIGLEDLESFTVDIIPFQGPVEIGTLNRTVINIEDNDIVRIQPSTENEVVFESDGTAEVCLTKDRNTSRPLSVNIVVQESTPSTNAATAGSDFTPLTSTLTFNPLDSEACTLIEIIDDNEQNEVPEVFSVNFMVLQADQRETELPNPTSMVTIIDDDVDTVLVNDTVIADPLFTAPVTGDAQICYEIHGVANTIFNLVSDKCTSVNARYVSINISESINIIGAVGVLAADSTGNCHTVEVRLTAPGSSSRIEVLVDGAPISGFTQTDSVRLRTYSDKVRISVPNCDMVDLVMWVIHMRVGGQSMLKYVITRGYNLAPTSHGLVGQFWNIPVTVEKYNGLLRPEDEPFFDRESLYLITVTPITGSMRTFLGELSDVSWDRKSGPCYYVGTSQGGRTPEREDNDPVIEGRYTDYQVAGLFEDNFKFSQFDETVCPPSAV